jgi:capsular exopolysaccharide synthesis family protein
MQVQDDPGRGSDLDLRHYLRVVARRRWIIILLAVALGLASMGWAFTKEDRYRASAELLLLAPNAVEADAQSISDDPDRAIANEIEIFGSEEMQQNVTEMLGDDFPSVSASPQGDNDVIVLTSESTDPEAAAESVNAYARAYERLRRQRTVEALRDELAGIQHNKQAKQDQLATLLRPLNALDTQIAATPPGPERDALVAQRQTREDGIANIRDSTLSAISDFNTQIAEIQRAMQNPSGGVDVLNEATTPKEPFYPQPKKDLLVGLVVGLLVGIAAAFIWEQLDDAVRGRADADRATGGLPVVGLVPRVAGWRNRADSLLVTRDDPRSSAAESYRSLVTSLEFLTGQGTGHVILFTSPGASEGKTTTVANVGMAFAEAGHRTVIVDADLRRPRLHSFFELSGAVGLSTVLVGKVDIATSVQTVQGDHPLDVVVAGPVAPNPAELLRSDITETALQKLRDAYDVVIIDSPPVLPVADALVLSRHADTTILLASADNTGRRRLASAVEALRQVDAPLQGIVLNGVAEGEGYEYGYYGDAEGTAPSKRSRRKEKKAKRRRGRRSRRTDKS